MAPQNSNSFSPMLFLSQIGHNDDQFNTTQSPNFSVPEEQFGGRFFLLEIQLRELADIDKLLLLQSMFSGSNPSPEDALLVFTVSLSIFSKS
jgi:hypothetical protein